MYGTPSWFAVFCQGQDHPVPEDSIKLLKTGFRKTRKLHGT
jgi:hypothetical protein